MSLLIYSRKKSPRLEYILDFIFKNVILSDYEITTNFDQFTKSTTPKINYSKSSSKNEIQIIPNTLLFETSICPQSISCFEWQGQKAFFKTSDSSVPFDIFSACFYLISRYEEYTNNKTDEFKRFPHKESLAFQNNFLTIPLVDIWLLEFKKILQEQFPNLNFEDREYTFIPTYDIDIAYSYRHKGFWRGFGGGVKDLFRGKIGSVFHRAFSVIRLAKDPYDSYGFLDKIHQKHTLSPIYFFLVGSRSEMDKNLPINSSAMKKLIKSVSEKYEIGLHPSYQSNKEIQLVIEERKNLRLAAEKKIQKTRQHYIKFTLPKTYDNLVQLNFEEDYSMGYGSMNGFRASTSSSFYWYNLSKELKTTLRIFPFCFMECNSKFEQKQGVVETEKELTHYINILKKTNGTFISVWHNFSLGSERQWKGWRKLYVHQVENSVIKEKSLLNKIKNIFS